MKVHDSLPEAVLAGAGESLSFPYPTPDQQRMFCSQFRKDQWDYLCMDHKFIELLEVNLYAAKLHADSALLEVQDVDDHLRELNLLDRDWSS